MFGLVREPQILRIVKKGRHKWFEAYLTSIKDRKYLENLEWMTWKIKL